MNLITVMPDLIRHPVEKGRPRRALFDWTPGRGLLLQSFRISYV